MVEIWCYFVIVIQVDEMKNIPIFSQSQMLNVWYIYLYFYHQNYPNVGK